MTIFRQMRRSLFTGTFVAIVWFLMDLSAHYFIPGIALARVDFGDVLFAATMGAWVALLYADEAHAP